jgi:lipooligosaccharide transport system permease protein
MAFARRALAVVGWHARGYRRMWRGTVTTSFLNPVFFLLSIGVLLGGLIDRAGPDLGGLSYLEFVAPGLLAATAMQTGGSSATYPVGAFVSGLAVVAPLAALLCGLAFAAVLAAICARLEDASWLAAIYRFGLMPLFLFSGTFFPVANLPDWLEPAAWATPLWHGVELCRDLASGRIELLADGAHLLYLAAMAAIGAVFAVRAYAEKLRG